MSILNNVMIKYGENLFILLCFKYVVSFLTLKTKHFQN